MFIFISAFAEEKRVYQPREQMRWDVDIHISSEEGKEEPGRWERTLGLKSVNECQKYLSLLKLI